MSEHSIEWFTAAIQRLPYDAPVQKGHPGYNNYTTQKDHWLGWLNPKSGAGTYPRSDAPGRNACYVYNHIVESKMLLWLISAAGVESALAHAASQAASNAHSMAGASAAIRKVVPWSVIAAALSSYGPSKG